jgi:acetoacetate decarboxylase
LKEIGSDGIVLEKAGTGETERMACDAVVLSLGYQPDDSLAEELKSVCPCVRIVGDALKVGRIGPAVRGGFEAGRSLFAEKPRQTGFRLSPEEVSRFAEVNIMRDMEGLTLAYLTYPSAIAKILPPPLKPFPMPVVSLSIRDIRRPTFAESYSEAILGCYAMFGARIGLYTVALLLDGTGAEMATQLGRDNLGIPKKLGATLRMDREGGTIRASIARRGTQLVDLEVELGAYNHPLMGALNQFPSYTRVSKGMAFYHMFDMAPDAAGKMRFNNVRLIGNVLETRYRDWVPGFASLKLQSGPDDPWGDLPVHTIIGGAFMKADMRMLTAHILAEPDPGETMPYLLTSRYDRTAFTEPG